MNHKNIKFVNKDKETFYHIFKDFFDTEKTIQYESTLNTITFIAPKWCTKTLIKRCMNCAMGGNEVVSVRIINTPGKYKKKYTKKGIMHCHKSSEKKVVLRLKAPEKLKEVLV